jgi:hypothetical protein
LGLLVDVGTWPSLNSLNIDIDVNCGEWMFPLLGVTGGEVLLFNVEEEEILEG